MELAVYGKGGIGKSTVSANLTAALTCAGVHVLQIGCDPKHDSTRLLMHGENIPTVLEYLRGVTKETERIDAVLKTGTGGVGCIEAGGPKPGVGCAGRGIISAFEFLDRHAVKAQYDMVVYDVLGDVVCGGFAVPVRREYADAIFLVTSGEYMALYAANNILRGIQNFDGTTFRRVAGIIYNERKLKDEDGRVQRFADAVGLPICARVPRSQAFAVAEEQNRTVMELDGFAAEQQVFRDLAERIRDGLPLQAACPLSDERLEEVVLSPEMGEASAVQTDRENAAASGYQRAPEVGRSVQTGDPGKAAGAYVTQCGEESDACGAKGCAGTGAAAGMTGQSGRSTETEKAADGQKPAAKRLPLYGCAFNGAAAQAIHLTDAIVIAHAPKACAFYTWQTISSSGRKNLFNRGTLMPSAISPHFSCTEMGQAEAVFGGMEKLKAHITAALEQKPGAVVVISSCVSGIIGDDIREIERMSTPEIPVIAIPADGDIAGDYMEGIRMCMDILAEKLIDPAVTPSGRRVNLIHETGLSNNLALNHEILRRLLSALGIQINCRFLGDATTQELRQFRRAPLNLLMDDSADGLRLKERLTKQYGCRFLEGGMPVGFRETAEFLRKLGDFFDCTKEAEQLIARETKAHRQRLAALKPALSGKRVVLTTINCNLDWLLEAAHEVGLRFVWVGVLNYLRTPLHVTAHPEFCDCVEETADWSHVQEKISTLRPDLVLSNYTSVIEEGDYVIDSIQMTPVAGFGSALQLLERWQTLLEKQKMQQEGGWKQDEAYFKKYYA